MNEAIRDLYQEVVLDHGKRPRNYRRVEHATHTAEGTNPLCGDQLSLSLRLADGVIADIGFQGSGCAISRASASLMTAALKGKRPAEALALLDAVHGLFTDGTRAVDEAQVGKLAVLAGVSEFPMRVKCATLAWHTLRSALATGGRVSTE
jgi:nitrogen fixation protein NifU and related proteins